MGKIRKEGKTKRTIEVEGEEGEGRVDGVGGESEKGKNSRLQNVQS